MRHSKHIKKLGRVRRARIALLRLLAVSLIEKRRIRTTEGKAKALRPFIERLLTVAQGATVHDRRIISARLGGQQSVVKELVDALAPQYKERSGGYTRIVKVAPRRSDASPMAVIEFI